MLKILQSYVSFHLQAATNSFYTLYRSPMISSVTILVIAMVLTLPVLFGVFSKNMEVLSQGWKRNQPVSLYLKTSLTAKEEAEVVKKVSAVDGVAEVSYKNKKEGLAELLQEEGMQDMMHSLTENPLPSVIDVLPALSFNTPEKMADFLKRLKDLPQIELAQVNMEWVNRLYAILGFGNKIAHILSLFLIAMVVFIVGNTLRFAIYYRNEEIQILKLIGASEAFIRRPFLYLGVWYGLFAAIFAVLFVNIFMVMFSWVFQDLLTQYYENAWLGLTVIQAYGIVFAAAFLGWLGARFTLMRI